MRSASSGTLLDPMVVELSDQATISVGFILVVTLLNVLSASLATPRLPMEILLVLLEPLLIVSSRLRLEGKENAFHAKKDSTLTLALIIKEENSASALRLLTQFQTANGAGINL